MTKYFISCTSISSIDHDGIEDFDEIALAATRDVANIQNHCVRLILNDHTMKLPIYGLQTRWDSEIPKKRKETDSTILTNMNSQVEVIRKSGVKTSNMTLPIENSVSSTISTYSMTTSITRDQELFLGTFARQLNEQTWEQLRTILTNLNAQEQNKN